MKDWDITEVMVQPMEWNTKIGVAFRFHNGMRHAFSMPVGSTMEDFIKGVKLIQKWVHDKEFGTIEVSAIYEEPIKDAEK